MSALDANGAGNTVDANDAAAAGAAVDANGAACVGAAAAAAGAAADAAPGTAATAAASQPSGGTAGSPNQQLWGGRFEGSPDGELQAFGASLDVDKRLWQEDIAGSKAHASMLAKQGIISEGDARSICSGLDGIAVEIASGSFSFDVQDEDIHMSIERQLTARIGEAGGRLHTARSRNDQVATDTRLYAKQQATALAKQLLDARAVLLRLASDHRGVIMPGYTHLQKAQPVLFAHHLLAYYWMLARDFKRMLAARDAADASPLGAAALAGTGHPIDRQQTATALGFAAVIPNSLDAVSDRDFLLDLVYACTVAMVHLSRLCEELILWSSNEFGFITLSDSYSTGSSIMPQKKNPDFAELVRGKTGRVVGDLVGLLTVLKGLPLAYNKDMQEDKEGAFDAIDTLSASLKAVTGMLATLHVNAEVMLQAAQGGYMAATDLADFLAEQGLPFREAHEVVGRFVLAAEKQGKALDEFTLQELQAVSPIFDEQAMSVLKIENVVARRQSEGGTAAEQVAAQLAQAEQLLNNQVSLL